MIKSNVCDNYVTAGHNPFLENKFAVYDDFQKKIGNDPPNQFPGDTAPPIQKCPSFEVQIGRC